MEHKCKECDKTIETNFSDREVMLKRKLCFVCNFWYGTMLNDLLPGRDRLTPIIENKEGKLTHYMICDESVTGPIDWRGFAGQEFIIDMEDVTIRTTNLWHQGTIPDHLRKWFKPRGRFLTLKEAVGRPLWELRNMALVPLPIVQ